MLKNIINASIGVMAGVSLLLSAHTTKSDEIWNMATAWGGGPFLEEDAKGYAKLVDTLTDGRIQISVFPGGTLGSPLKVSDTVKANVVQAGHTWMGYDWGIDKTTVLFGNMAGGLNPGGTDFLVIPGGCCGSLVRVSQGEIWNCFYSLRCVSNGNFLAFEETH